MARKLCDILADLDVRIEKRAQAKSASVLTSENDDDVEKLAEILQKSAPRKSSLPLGPRLDATEVEKLAHSMAIVETLLGGQQLAKVCELEKVALERGVPQEEVQEVVTKYASRAELGGRVADFMKGMGSGLSHRIESFGKTLSKNVPEAAGEVAGMLAPGAALAGTGMYIGSKAKERQIRRKMGIH